MRQSGFAILAANGLAVALPTATILIAAVAFIEQKKSDEPPTFMGILTALSIGTTLLYLSSTFNMSSTLLRNWNSLHFGSRLGTLFLLGSQAMVTATGVLCTMLLINGPNEFIKRTFPWLDKVWWFTLLSIIYRCMKIAYNFQKNKTLLEFSWQQLLIAIKCPL